MDARCQYLHLSWGIWDAKLAAVYVTDSDFVLTNYHPLPKKKKKQKQKPTPAVRRIIGTCLDSDLLDHSDLGRKTARMCPGSVFQESKTQFPWIPEHPAVTPDYLLL